jgi:hypothetical protein
MRSGDQRGYSAQQDQTLDVSRSLVQAVEDLAARIIGGNRIHVAANGIASNDNHDQKDQPAEQPYPVQTHQRAADNQTGGMNARGRSGEKRRKLAKRDWGENGAEEHQRAQPKAEHQVDERVKERSHVFLLILHGTPSGEPLNTKGHRRMGGEEASQAGSAQKGRNNKKVRGRWRSRQRQAFGVSIELLQSTRQGVRVSGHVSPGGIGLVLS